MTYFRRFLTPANIYPFLITVFSLIFITIYTYAYFVEIPYIGFIFVSPTPTIVKIFSTSDEMKNLQIGDQILSFGSVDWTNFTQENYASRSFPSMQPGQTVPVKILRNNQNITINWKIPGLNWAELINRLTDIWYLAYFFWIFAVLTLFLIRPRDLLWFLMAAFFLCVALWLGAGFGSYGSVWYSSVNMRIVTWIMMAVSLHFHWNFPRPFFRINPIFIFVLYLLAGILAFLELLQWLPADSYLIGINVVVFGSLGMLMIHLLFFTQNRQRSHMMLIGVAVLLILVTQLGTSIHSKTEINYLTRFTLLFTPLLPLVYFYSVYSNQIGGLEFRFNRLISLIVFLILVFIVAGSVITGIQLAAKPEALALTAVISTSIASVSGAVIYPSFQKWFERTFMGLPQIPADLPSSYTNLLIDKLEIKNITDILENKLFPSLLVRQAMVIRIHADKPPSEQPSYYKIAHLGVPNESVPSPLELDKMISSKQANIFNLNYSIKNTWIKLSLPLRAGNNNIGVCLLGKRDPDDYYSPTEIPILQALMDQTALAIIHVEQSSNMRAFHQADILRQEEEHKRLARILHDEVLGQMTVMALNADLIPENTPLQQSYLSAVENIRSLISSLRPSSLNFGLQVALEDCKDNIENQIKLNSDNPDIILTSEGDPYIRYPADTEIQLFRIAQQACFNAIQHAKAKTIFITAIYTPEQINFSIKDDGCGFEVPRLTDISGLLEKQHYGLVGMLERAALIQAEVNIYSNPGLGTEVGIQWNKNAGGQA